jgi:hypothetical protein
MIGLAYAAEVVAETMAPAVVAVTTVAGAWDQLLVAVIAIIIPIVSTIGTYAVVLVRSFMKAKISKIKNDELRAAADFAMLRLDRIITNVVKEIQQTRPTGETISVDKAKAYLNQAVAMVKSQVTEDIMEVIQGVVKDPERYFVTKIEAAVGELKAAQPNVATEVRAEMARWVKRARENRA